MFERAPKTVYFRHFEKQGLRTVFALEDARISGAILGKMIVKDDQWEQACRQFAEYGLKVADVMPNDIPNELPQDVAKATQRQLSLM